MFNRNTRHPLLQLFCSSRFASRAVRQFVVMSVLCLVMLSGVGGLTLFRASAQMTCAAGDQAYSVVDGDTLSAIALDNNLTPDSLASYNNIANADQIYAGQQLCIPAAQGQGQTVDMTQAQSQAIMTEQNPTDAAAVDMANGNPYPYGQCTWWASQRYFQLHGIYVPWTTNADAWEWTARAIQFHWKVSSKPTVGAIMDLQPWTQGAYNLGHVAVVEKILSNGHITASNMNWGGSGSHVVNVDFVPGRGVTFLTAK